jgi:UDP-N-acetylmuramoyl-tripeptide--D-alanyl-D-alanine ligase
VLGDMLELGPREQELHAEVGRRCAALGLDMLVTVGPRSEIMARAAAQAGAVAHHVGDDLEAAAAWVRATLSSASPGAVLIKASRGVRLERLATALLGDAPR